VLTARDFVEARLYESEEEVIQDALRHLLRSRPELRIQLAVHRDRTEEISLAKAASFAGVKLGSDEGYSVGAGHPAPTRSRNLGRGRAGDPDHAGALPEPAMSVIVHTTVISNFAGIGRLDLLRQLYGNLYISRREEYC
jgi:Arc/MetJ-type ribon-helix-helix transcriptional regulator